MNVRFHTGIELVLRFGEAHRSGTLEKLVRDLQKLDLLIVDEWSMFPRTRRAPSCFSVSLSTATRARVSSLRPTSSFQSGGRYSHGRTDGDAMIVRVIHHGHLLLFEGRSYRMTHTLICVKQLIPVDDNSQEFLLIKSGISLGFLGIPSCAPPFSKSLQVNTKLSASQYSALKRSAWCLENRKGCLMSA